MVLNQDPGKNLASLVRKGWPNEAHIGGGWITRCERGKHGSGGKPFSRGALYASLQNPLYIGQIRHKDKTYDGNHDAIIDKDLWNAVQAALKRNRHEKYLRTHAKTPSLLAGLLYDEAGHPLSPTHTRKKSRRYRYYMNQALVQFKQTPPDAVTRIPAQSIEALVEQEVVGLLTEPTKLMEALSPIRLAATGVSDRYVSQLLKPAVLSPRIIQRIFKGDIPHDLTLGKLKATTQLDWETQ